MAFQFPPGGECIGKPGRYALLQILYIQLLPTCFICFWKEQGAADPGSGSENVFILDPGSYMKKLGGKINLPCSCRIRSYLWDIFVQNVFFHLFSIFPKGMNLKIFIFREFKLNFGDVVGIRYLGIQKKINPGSRSNLSQIQRVNTKSRIRICNTG
jgi:hypothetical protein